MDDRALDISL